MARIYLVPGCVTDDGIVKVQSTVLITKFGNLYEVTEFQGEVVGLADLNGDGIPELQISASSDGTCESVSSVVRQAPVGPEISNH